MDKKIVNSNAKIETGFLNQKAKMPRRKFLESSVLGAVALPSVIAFGNGNDKSSNVTDPFSCIDYGKSFFCNTADFNAVRMWIESRTTIIDTKLGSQTVYYKGAACKSENTFGQKDLFYEDNYDFTPIFGDGKVLVFRSHSSKRGDSYRTTKNMEEMWGGNPVIYTPGPEVVTELDTWEKIRDATAAGIPIVTQTEFSNESTGLKAIIECPCKTMNISHPKRMYQVDTGPIAFPDLSKRFDAQIDCLELAFIAFMNSSFADFVIKAPTAIMEGNKEVATVLHYSKLVTIDNAKNKIFALGKVD
jgi:hypothetical protein